MKYRSIQIVRAIASILVICLHSIDVTNDVTSNGLGIPSWLSTGYAGVDIFFIVSGFIISFVIDKTNVGYVKFFLKRCVRILPFYWILTLIWTFLLLVSGRPMPSGPELAISLLVLPSKDFPVLGVGWSLEHEFIFYTVVTLLLMIHRKTLIPYVLFALTLIAIFWHMAPRFDHYDYRLFSLYNFNFLLGVLIHRFRMFIMRLHSGILLGFGTVTFLAAGAVVANLYGGGHVPTGPDGIAGLIRVLCFGVAGALLVSGLIALEAESPWIFNTQWMKACEEVGNASYGLYLTHPIVYAAIGFVAGRLRLPPSMAWSLALFAILAAIAAALAWYHMIERPFLRWIEIAKRKGAMVTANGQ